jgi:hypothetical protein
MQQQQVLTLIEVLSLGPAWDRITAELDFMDKGRLRATCKFLRVAVETACTSLRPLLPWRDNRDTHMLVSLSQKATHVRHVQVNSIAFLNVLALELPPLDQVPPDLGEWCRLLSLVCRW